ncbi:hypothetical protein HKD37_04G011230 [Glycine soja]
MESLIVFPLILDGLDQTCFIRGWTQAPHIKEDVGERHRRLTMSARDQRHPTSEPKLEPQAVTHAFDRIIGPPFGGGLVDLSLI